MSNAVVRVLLFASGLFMLSSPVLADWQADCSALDTASAADPNTTTPPGYCTKANATKQEQDKFQPPGACATASAISAPRAHRRRPA